MMHFKSTLAVLTAGCLLCTAAAIPSAQGTASLTAQAATSDSIENQMDWGTVEIGGGGFVSGIITGKKIMSGGMKFLMERPALFNAALWAAPMVNGLPRFMKYNDFDDWGKGRELPEFAKESFNEMWKKNEVQGKEESK